MSPMDDQLSISVLATTVSLPFPCRTFNHSGTSDASVCYSDSFSAPGTVSKIFSLSFPVRQGKIFIAGP
jgi:hypothetical protein